MKSPWAWHAHPSVWAVIGLVAFGYAAALRLVGPKVGGQTARRQIATFYTGVALMWIAADWPAHDLAERYLFSVHMVQHILLTLVVPPLLLVGTPDWLKRWLLRPPSATAAVRFLARPLLAAVIYNTAFVFTHWPPVVDAALRSEGIHFGAHCLIFFTALLMWFPVMNRMPEFPMLTPPARMVYLFLQSVIPTVPASFITFADGVIYKFYATVPHPFHLSAVADQQLAGALMKVLGGSILWGVIVVMFFRWYAEENRRPRTQRDDVLTWDDVARELERTPPPPSSS
ncbi:MAG TPA: cytochrome c oxidase assembly protein [Acidimicrobiales bacterium]|nr:cytochrome c oxidase assembly protein [Acidimicrobiales bacterium]